MNRVVVTRWEDSVFLEGKLEEGLERQRFDRL